MILKTKNRMIQTMILACEKSKEKGLIPDYFILDTEEMSELLREIGLNKFYLKKHIYMETGEGVAIDIIGDTTKTNMTLDRILARELVISFKSEIKGTPILIKVVPTDDEQKYKATTNLEE